MTKVYSFSSTCANKMLCVCVCVHRVYIVDVPFSWKLNWKSKSNWEFDVCTISYEHWSDTKEEKKIHKTKHKLKGNWNHRRYEIPDGLVQIFNLTCTEYHWMVDWNRYDCFFINAKCVWKHSANLCSLPANFFSSKSKIHKSMCSCLTYYTKRNFMAHNLPWHINRNIFTLIEPNMFAICRVIFSTDWECF